MKIILANPRGFCAGVNMAIDSLEKALELFGTPLYVYHEIVHNRHVVDRFSRQGVVFVDRMEELTVPVTLAWAEHDKLVRRPRRPVPGATMVDLPGCGHIPTWDDPELVTRVVLQGSRSPG